MPQSKPRIQLLAIGNELVFGSTQDTNSSFIAQTFAKLGADVCHIALVKDELIAISESLAQAAEHSELIVTTGGLGPTSDDLTRNAVAKAAGVGLAENAQARVKLTDFFSRRNRPLNPNNLRQIEFPEGAAVIPNRLGTADAFVSKMKNSQGKEVMILSLPGIPKETVALMDEHIAPWFQKQFPTLRAPIATYLRCFGVSESFLGMKIEALHLPESIEISYRPMFPEILITFYHRGNIAAEKQREELQHISAQAEQAIGPEFVFSQQVSQSLAERIGELFCQRKLKLAAAESCSGGLLAHQLVSISGASEFFSSSVVSYSNEAKSVFLGVRPALLQRYGAVSEKIATEMARGVRYRAGADIGVSITGIAGPDGGTAEKPVGTFWIGLCAGDNEEAYDFFFPAERNHFRQYCVSLALDLVRRKLLGLPMTWERR